MTDAKTEILAKPGAAGGAGHDADPSVRAERRAIGKQLHQGILQDLTVAGLRLAVLREGAPEPAATAIAELATWLQERQAELRALVSNLEQGNPGGGDLLVVVAALQQRHGCDLAVDLRLQGGEFEPGLRAAMLETIGGLGAILAGPLAARRIDVQLAEDLRPILRVLHDGQDLADNAGQLAAARALVGRAGASLRIERAGREQLTLDWTD